jgi:uncharacterized protein YodC (DUF2158 family)
MVQVVSWIFQAGVQNGFNRPLNPSRWRGSWQGFATPRTNEPCQRVFSPQIVRFVWKIGNMTRYLFGLIAVIVVGVLVAIASASQPVPVTAPAPTTGLSTGQIVQLTAGGPWLTVVKPETGTPPMATVTWYEYSSGKFETAGPLPQNCFRVVTPKEVECNATIANP